MKFEQDARLLRRTFFDRTALVLMFATTALTVSVLLVILGVPNL